MLSEYPDGYGPESAFYALDGPDDQVQDELRQIIRECREHGTFESNALADEAEEYLEDFL